MDPQIKRIIEVCRFEEDPSWEIMKGLFDGVTIEDYHKILENRDKVIGKLLVDSDAKPVFTKDDLEKSIEVIDGIRIMIKEPIFTEGTIHLADQGVHIKSHVYLGKNVSLSDVLIHTEAYISDGARLEYSKFQSGNRRTFVGENTVVSNVDEIRGCFISGGPLRKEGRKQIWLHARSVNNLIMGAYTGASVGFDVFNHPLGNDESVVIAPGPHKNVTEKHTFAREAKYRKLPVLIGMEAVIGAGSLLNSGSIVGANTIVPNRAEVAGLVYMRDDQQNYEPARKPKTL